MNTYAGPKYRSIRSLPIFNVADRMPKEDGKYTVWLEDGTRERVSLEDGGWWTNWKPKQIYPVKWQGCPDPVPGSMVWFDEEGGTHEPD